MTTRISSRDWETISAYLDDQLDRREKARLENRLQKDSDLRKALEEMRRTRLMLRNLPKMRAPRNYTLTPKMVGIREKSVWTPRFFGFASALATLLFVLVFVGDYLTPTNQVSVAQMTAAPSYKGGAEEAPMSAPESSETPAGEPELGNQRLAVPPETSQAFESMPAQETEVPGVMKAMAPEATVAPLAEDTQKAGGLEETVEPPGVETPGRVFRPFADINPTALRGLEAALALIALVTGLAAFFLRKGA